MKQILIDSLNGFNFKDIPLFLFHILSAALLAFFLGLIYRIKKLGNKNEIFYFPIAALAIAFLAALVKISVAFAVIGLIAVIFLQPVAKNRTFEQQIYFFILAVLSVGCGIGSVVLTGLAAPIIFVFLLLVPKAQKD